MRIALDRLYKGINAKESDDIIVNSCATEGNNTVIKGVYYGYIRSGKKSEIVTTQVEHPCVINSCRFLETLGVKIIYLPGIHPSGQNRSRLDHVGEQRNGAVVSHT